MTFQWLIHKQSCLNSTSSWSGTYINLIVLGIKLLHHLLAWTHQSELRYHQCIDEYSLVPSLVLLLDGFANVVAAIAAVICLQAFLQKTFGILMVAVWLCWGLVHNETVSHNYLCPPFPLPCSPEAETITHIHCGQLKINNYLYSCLVVVNASF